MQIRLRNTEIQMYFQKQLTLFIIYKFLILNGKFKIDLLVQQAAVVKPKCIDGFPPVYKAQLLPYSPIFKIDLRLLALFCVLVLKDGFRRIACASFQ